MIEIHFMRTHCIAAALSAAFLSACGGGGGSSSSTPPDTGGGTTPSPTTPPAETAQGVFLDSAVEGLTYRSGDSTGETDANGTFTYEIDKEITFTLGDIVIGTASGTATITPLNLVANTANENDPTVVNILRFIQSADDDGDADNGIQITGGIRAQARNQSANFVQSANDFEDDGAVQTAAAELTAVSSAGARMLISEADAVAHFREMLGIIDSPPPSGVSTLTLSGDDTAQIGTTLRTGDIKYGRRDLTGVLESIIIVDEGSMIPDEGTSTELIIHDDINNLFVISASDFGISMSVVRNLTTYSYTCVRAGTSDNCSTLDFDTANRTVTFTDTTVENTSTSSVLTINGMVQAERRGRCNMGYTHVLQCLSGAIAFESKHRDDGGFEVPE